MKKIVSLYLFLSYFACDYETCMQIRKILRLQSAQINLNYWILCTTKICPLESPLEIDPFLCFKPPPSMA